MDCTPSDKAFEAMSKFTDAFAGEEPSKLDHGPGAMKIREKRRAIMDFLHNFAVLCMREGVNRKVMELRGGSGQAFDKEDREAQARAHHDAQLGKVLVFPGGKH